MALLQLKDLGRAVKVEGFIKYTRSICPDCNGILPATIFEREGKVWLLKRCPEHGDVEELYFGSSEMYEKFSAYWKDGRGTENPNIPSKKFACPLNCGLCTDHISHTALANIIVTNRCDLTCWYCFFYVKKGLEGAYVYEPTLEEIREMVRTLRAERPVPGNSIQLTGGEPTLRKDLVDIVKVIKGEGVDHIQLNTNGINLALHPELALRLKEAGVSNLYMSFDGITPRSNPKSHWEAPPAIENCRKAGMGVVLVPTIIKGVNDHELGEIVGFARRNIDIVRSVNFQPVSLCGRLTKKEREKYRITISDCIEKIDEQTLGEIPTDAWFPIPSCTPFTNFVEALTRSPKYELSTHFICGAGTYVFEDKEKGRLIPITDFVDIKGLLEYLDEKADEIREGAKRYWVAAKVAMKLNSFIDKERQPSGLSLSRLIAKALIWHDYKSLGRFHMKSLFLGMMHFQDKYNHDEERVQRCDIHYLTPDLRILPFCAFNVIPEWYRDRVQQKFGIPVEEWERRTGERLEDSLYRGSLRKGQASSLQRLASGTPLDQD